MKTKYFALTRLALVLMILAICWTSAQASSTVHLPSMVKGMSFWNWSGDVSSSYAQTSFNHMLDVHPNCFSVTINWWMNSPNDTYVQTTSRTAGYSQLATFASWVNGKNKWGMNVNCMILKPQIYLPSPYWSGNIGNGYTSQSQWNSLCSSYTSLVVGLAKTAQSLNTNFNNVVKGFSVGNELVLFSRQVSCWQGIISQVRSAYYGDLFYSADRADYSNSLTDQWSTNLDRLALSPYYSVATHNDPSPAEVQSAWAIPDAQLKSWSAAHGNKCVMFSEIGYRSVKGALQQPWNSWMTGTADQYEQNSGYQGLFMANTGQPWWCGVAWWFWDTNPNTGLSSGDTNYTPYNKSAEGTVAYWFTH